MKILRLLNKKNLSIILIFLFFGLKAFAEDKPVDIWNLEKIEPDEIKVENNSTENNSDQESSLQNILQTQTQNKKNQIELDETLTSKEIEIDGLFDPEINGLSINMWSNSNGDQLRSVIKNLNNIRLSRDAVEILNILLLTNAYYPEQNINRKEFLKIKSNWLIKNTDLDLISKYIVNNKIINESPELLRHLVDQFLSKSDVEKSCEVFSKISKPINDDYLSKFNIYCLFYKGKFEEAQMIYDLKKEYGFKDDYYENKINYLFGLTDQTDEKISENSILNFHLAHRSNKDFNFEPKNTTSKIIWKYLSSSNLLFNIADVEITDLNKVSTIEKATHDENYTEQELFELYKRFQFNINQLLTIKSSYKTLPKSEGRALIYQGILLTSNPDKKIELMKILKDSFVEDNISNAFNKELKNFLDKINIEEIPSNFTSFYNRYSKDNKISNMNIKLNNKILHQSKLIDYFKNDYKKKDIEKNINDFLKKIKKDKKYFISKKDIIFLEALKSDGIKISKKYTNLYEINESEMPKDIQIMIDNDDMGGALLRVVEVIGQDKLEDIDDDTIYFIINTLNQLDAQPIRNNILLKILPLKV